MNKIYSQYPTLMMEVQICLLLDVQEREKNPCISLSKLVKVNKQPCKLEKVCKSGIFFKNIFYVLACCSWWQEDGSDY